MDKTVTLEVYIINDINLEDNINATALQNTLEQNLEDKFGDNIVVVEITEITDNEDKSTDIDYSEFAEQQELFQQLTIMILTGFLLILATSLIDAKYIRKNDYYQIVPLFGALFHILDTWTDVFFALQCYIHPLSIFGSFNSSIFINYILCQRNIGQKMMI